MIATCPVPYKSLILLAPTPCGAVFLPGCSVSAKSLENLNVGGVVVRSPIPPMRLRPLGRAQRVFRALPNGVHDDPRN